MPALKSGGSSSRTGLSGNGSANPRIGGRAIPDQRNYLRVGQTTGPLDRRRQRSPRGGIGAGAPPVGCQGDDPGNIQFLRQGRPGINRRQFNVKEINVQTGVKVVIVENNAPGVTVTIHDAGIEHNITGSHLLITN